MLLKKSDKQQVFSFVLKSHWQLQPTGRSDEARKALIVTVTCKFSARVDLTFPLNPETARQLEVSREELKYLKLSCTTAWSC